MENNIKTLTIGKKKIESMIQEVFDNVTKDGNCIYVAVTDTMNTVEVQVKYWIDEFITIKMKPVRDNDIAAIGTTTIKGVEDPEKVLKYLYADMVNTDNKHNIHQFASKYSEKKDEIYIVDIA